MPTLVSDVIQLSYEDLAVVQPGETISTTLQTAGFTTLNGLLGSLNAERYTAFQKVLQTFPLQAGQSAYTLGSGGSFATTGNLRAQRVEAWSAFSGNFRTGGDILSFPEFQAKAVDPAGGSTTLPLIVGADEAFPLINVRVFPTPATGPGQIELAYWTPLLAFAAVGSTITLPEGWINMLRFNLAVLLYPRHARLGGLPPELAANAQNSKASLVQQNAPEQAAA